MHTFNHPLILFLICWGLCPSCYKEVESGTRIQASGSVVDPVKNKPLPFATLYLFGAKSTFYGIYYTIGPLDSVKTDAQGNFDLTYQAEGNSIDYGLSLGILNYGGPQYPDEPYVRDKDEPVFKFNFQKQIKNARVRGRELSFTRLQLQVDNNPLDSFWIKTTYLRSPILLRGKSIDTVLYLRHLPQAENIIRMYVESPRDTLGLAQANRDVPKGGNFYYANRTIEEVYLAKLSDTFLLNKRIPDIMLVPRSKTCCK